MMKAYPEYRDSGVEWLGDVPSHWEVCRLGTHFFQRSEKVNDTDYPPLSVTKTGIVPQLDNVAKTDANDNRKKVREGDFVINSRSDRKGSSGVSSYEGSVSLISIVLEPKNYSSSYAHHLFRSYNFQEEFYRYGSGIVADLWSTRYADMKNISIPLMPLAEQDNIAKYLDSETTRIDNLIAEKQNFIKLLSEKRQALISHVVTKGLNPNVPMKDSGVEWIGEIPEHWVAKPIKYLGTLNPNKSELSEEYLQKTCSFVPMTKLKTDSLMLDEVKPVLEVFDGYTYFKDEDVLFAKVTPCFENKNMCIAKDLDNGIGFGSSEINVFRVNKLTDNRYFYYLIQEDHFMQFAKSNMTGTGGLKRVPSEVILDYKVAVPCVEEQREIADYLESKFKKLNELTNETNKSIELLKEHRIALISAAVTGKIDVREEV